MSKPHYHVTAGLIRRQDCLLIARRPAGKHLAGLWEFPGGKQEEGETLKECLARELKEELGLEVAVGELFMSVAHEYETKFVTLHCFLCSLVQGTPSGLEGQESRWVRDEELKEFAFTPPDKIIIDRLLLKRQV
ncbi:MAG: 8-oxo-dGTP diphosphatase MutT [Desulfobacteraceae bacterium]|nr:MAG: 8-oxo-dGTP diphosphatase MutT [Desulfobacteraceae bacterium]